MNLYLSGTLTANKLGAYQSALRLSSGLRLNSASDDAAGIAISSNLDKQISGQSQAMRNISDGLSLIEVHSGALSEVSELFNRARELALQSSNGTLTTSDRANLNQEYSQIMDQVDDIFTSTRFNGQSLFQNGGPPSTVNIQSGDAPGNVTPINLIDYSTITGPTLPSDILTQANAQAALSTIDSAATNTTLSQSQLGATHNGLSTIYKSTESNILQTQKARGKIVDADYAKEVTSLAKYQLLQGAGFAMQRKVQQNQSQLLLLLN